MTIEQLITDINSHMPSLELIIAKYKKFDPMYDERKANEFLINNHLIVTARNTKSVSDIENLINSTNISKVGVGIINFLSQFKILSPVLHAFASYNDYYYVGHHLTNKGIWVKSIYSYEEEIITPYVSDFFQFLALYDSYYKNIVWGMPINSKYIRAKTDEIISRQFSTNWIREFIQLEK